MYLAKLSFLLETFFSNTPQENVEKRAWDARKAFLGPLEEVVQISQRLIFEFSEALRASQFQGKTPNFGEIFLKTVWISDVQE